LDDRAFQCILEVCDRKTLISINAGRSMIKLAIAPLPAPEAATATNAATNPATKPTC
jgi:hypothetical protein